MAKGRKSIFVQSKIFFVMINLAVHKNGLCLMPLQCRDFLVFAFCKGILCTSSMMGETICQLITASLYMTIFSQKYYFLLRSLVSCYLLAKKKNLWMVHNLWHPKLYIDFVHFCPVFVLATCALSDLLYSDEFSWTVVYFCLVVSAWGKEPQCPKWTGFLPRFATENQCESLKIIDPRTFVHFVF